MHLTHALIPAATILANISLVAAGLFILTTLIFIIFLRHKENAIVIALPAMAVFLLAIIPAIILGVTDSVQTGDQLKTQASSRYNIQLGDTQINDLLESNRNKLQTVQFNDKTATLLGSTSDGTQLISLIQIGNTYLLTGSNLTELPHT